MSPGTSWLSRLTHVFLNLQFMDEETEFCEHNRFALDRVSHPRQNRN